jgi:ribokinase
MGSTDADDDRSSGARRRPDGGQPRVAVVGSYNAGVVAEVPRFPVPGETVTGTSYEETVGGKGSNQAVGAARLGADVRFVGCVGEDRHGEVALDLWEREGVDASAVDRVEERTGVGIVIVDGDGENEIVVVPGANGVVDGERVRAAREAIADCDVLLVQLEIGDDAVAAAVAVADEAGLTVVCDPAPARELPAEVLERVDYLTPNEQEARTLAGLAPDADVADVEVAARLRELGAGAVVTTLGADGALVDDGERRERVPAPDVDAVDTTGAGDAFDAAFAVALAEGRGPVDAARFGCGAGAASVTAFDVVPSLPGRERVEELGGDD